MEVTPEPKPIVDSERVNLVFAEYDDFTKALEWQAPLFNVIREMGLTGVVNVSLDSGSSAEDKPLMSFVGPRPVVDMLIESLNKDGVNYNIDVTKSDEPDIVKRK